MSGTTSTGKSVVSISSFGAVGDGITNNQAAIQNAFNYAAANGDSVYIPLGTFAYSGTLTANGINIYGAGSTSVLKPLDVANESLIMTGTGGAVSELQMDSSATTRLSTEQSAMIWVNGAHNFTVDNVLIDGSSSVGIFNVGGTGGKIYNNTVENTLADSISDIQGASNTTISGNRIINAGDDGISNNSYAGSPEVSNITITGNTVINNLWGRGIEVSGGDDIQISGNYVQGGPADLAGIYISSEAGWNTISINNVSVTGNTLVNSGGTNGQGAILVWNSGNTYTVTGVTVSGNQIVNPLSQALEFVSSGVMTAVADNNTDYTTSSSLTNESLVPGDSVSLSGNQILSPSSYTTPLVSPGGGVGSAPTPTPTPTPTPAPTPSANDTVVKAGSTAAITDTRGNKWTITTAGQVAVNGTVDAITSNVTQLAYVNGTIWQENSNNLWWGETKPNDSWLPTAGTSTSPLPVTPTPTPTPAPTPSANDTVVKAGSTAAITDTSGNKWTITTAGQVAVNGTVDAITSNVTQLAYVNGTIWQENSNNLWWGETKPNDSWLPTAGTSTSPLPVTPTPTPTPAPTPSANDTVVKAGSTAAITDTSGNKWTITTAGQVAVNGTVDAITSNVTQLAYVNGTIWQENSNNLWWGETKPNDSWLPTAGTSTSPLPVTPTPTPTPAPTPSANDTVVKAGSTAAITDTRGNKWTITTAGQVAVNGTVDAITSNVTQLAYVNGTIWQENSNNLWWGETKPNDSWLPTAGTSTSPLPVTPTPTPTPAPTPSANDTVVKAGSTAAITDTSGNKWTITTAGQVAVNGTVDAITSNVTQLAYVNGTIWQENSNNLWWGETKPNDSWLPTAGTSTSPLPATTVTIPASTTSETIAATSATINVTSGNHLLMITGHADTFNLSGGIETITDNGSGDNTFHLAAAGDGSAVFNAAALSNADVFDLSAALKHTTWAGSATTLSSYLQTVHSGPNTALLVSAAAKGTGTLLATFNGSTASLSTILSHAII